MSRNDIILFLQSRGWIRETDSPYDQDRMIWRDPVNRCSWYTMKDAYDIEMLHSL